ncbi:MAG: hypothetical protein QW524_01055 [Candidatus Woesearchaeota archaeon]
MKKGSLKGFAFLFIFPLIVFYPNPFDESNEGFFVLAPENMNLSVTVVDLRNNNTKNLSIRSEDLYSTNIGILRSLSFYAGSLVNTKANYSIILFYNDSNYESFISYSSAKEGCVYLFSSNKLNRQEICFDNDSSDHIISTVLESIFEELTLQINPQTGSDYNINEQEFVLDDVEETFKTNPSFDVEIDEAFYEDEYIVYTIVNKNCSQSFKKEVLGFDIFGKSVYRSFSDSKIATRRTFRISLKPGDYSLIISCGDEKIIRNFSVIPQGDLCESIFNGMVILNNSLSFPFKANCKFKIVCVYPSYYEKDLDISKTAVVKQSSIACDVMKIIFKENVRYFLSQEFLRELEEFRENGDFFSTARIDIFLWQKWVFGNKSDTKIIKFLSIYPRTFGYELEFFNKTKFSNDSLEIIFDDKFLINVSNQTYLNRTERLLFSAGAYVLKSQKNSKEKPFLLFDYNFSVEGIQIFSIKINCISTNECLKEDFVFISAATTNITQLNKSLNLQENILEIRNNSVENVYYPKEVETILEDSSMNSEIVEKNKSKSRFWQRISEFFRRVQGLFIKNPK